MRDNAPWFNQTLTTVNDAVVRLGIFEGDFPWHKHVDQDEFFFVLEREIELDVKGPKRYAPAALPKAFRGAGGGIARHRPDR